MIRVILSRVGMFCLLATSPAFAAEDDYLKMLEGEAASLELDPSGQLVREAEVGAVKSGQHQQDVFRRQVTLDGENLPKGMAQDAFESVLRDNFYGTYLFYQRLNTADRRTVYYRYTKAESTNLENVRKNILELLKQ